MKNALFTLLLCLVLDVAPAGAEAEAEAPVSLAAEDQDPVRLEDLPAQARDEWQALVALNREVIEHLGKGQYQQAIPSARDGLRRTEILLGTKHPEVATRLNNLAALLESTGRSGEAEPLYRRSLAIDEAVHGPEHPDVALDLNNLAVLLRATGRYGEAEPLFRRALAIRETFHGTEHPRVAGSLNNLAQLLRVTGRYGEAEPLVRRALAIREKVHGPEHPAVATGLNNLAALLQTTGRYGVADPLYRRALAIDEKVYGAEHPAAARDLNNLAALLENAGRYAEAEPLYRRALATVEAVHGPEHPAVATGLNNLANLLRTTGRYAEAEPLLRRALAIGEKVHGSEHPTVATSLNNLAVLLQITGRYGGAEPLYRRALAIDEKVHGPEHPDVARDINNLAMLLQITGRYGEAELLVRRALAIHEHALGPKPPLVATSLNNLGVLLWTTGRYGEAEPLYRSALTIYEAVHGSAHADIAVSLSNLASLLRKTGRYGEAEPLYRRALAIQERVLGPEPPVVANSLNNLAALFDTSGRSRDAEPLFRRAMSIAGGRGESEVLWTVQGNLGGFCAQRGRPGTAILFGKRAVNTLQSVRGGLEPLDRSAKQAFVKSKEGYYKHLSDLLIAEGRLAEAQQVLEMLKEAEYFQFIRRDASEDVRQSRIAYNAFEQEQLERLDRAMAPLRRIGAELADLERIDAQMRRPEEAERLAALRDEHKAASDELFSALDRIELAFAELGAERQRALNARLALPSDQRALVRRLGKGTVLVQYLVLEDQLRILVTTPEGITAYRLEAGAKAINQAVFVLYEALRSPGGDPHPASRGLYDILIAPIARDLAAHKARQLMVYLDGTLRYLPLAALHDGKRYLIERYAIAVYTSVGRARVAQRPAADWSVSALGTSRAVEGFAPLPAVRQELEGIVRRDAQDPDGVLAGTIRLDGAFTRAGLAASLSDKSPVLHLATHFVFKPGTESDSYLLLGDGSRLDLRALRTGAYDFAAIDLLTLSACETAIGGANAEGKEIEGMGALVQRKGAKLVLATLWPVADASTGLFMQRLYRLRTEQDLTKAEALRRTQLAFLSGEIESKVGKARGTLVPLTPDNVKSEAQTATDYRHPYYWAPFILMGNWL